MRTDQKLLSDLVARLVDNAIGYTQRRGVLVGCRRRHGKTWIEVWDTGIGIPETEMAEIFEPFRQLDNEARSPNKGYGLGLTIVARTAGLLALDLVVQSRPGKGSLSAVEVPMACPQTERADKAIVYGRQ